MTEKRRDSKNRVLNNGEYQKNNGRYEYRYIDSAGNKHSIYSWQLVSTDRIPQGMKCTESLRDAEKRILRDLNNGINTYEAKKITLNKAFENYISTKCDLKGSTLSNYVYMYDRFVSKTIGNKSIDSIKYSDIKRFYKTLLESSLKSNSLEIIHTLLHPTFYMAVRDGYIRSNPTDGVMSEIKKSPLWIKSKRHALTKEQQKAFLEYVENSRVYSHWLNVFKLFLGTGCRASELLGLRWEDCDFDNRIININHNLIYRQYVNEGCAYHVTTPKTYNSIRYIPMTDKVYDILTNMYKAQKSTGFNSLVIDGYTNFIFINRNGTLLSAASLNRAIKRILKEYNDELKTKSDTDNNIVYLPDFSLHNFRHTFCTRLCETETDIKTIQEIMGHSDIETTMEIYNESTMERKKKTIRKINDIF